MKKYDIAIVGAGVVGALLANLLAEKIQLSIALIDAKPPANDWSKETTSARVSALTYSVIETLQDLGVWQQVADRRASAYTHMHVWDANSSGAVDFDCRDVGLPALGYLVENNLLQQVLLDNCRDGVDYLMPFALKKLDNLPDAVLLESAEGELIRTELLIGADGAHSWVRQQAGFVLDEKPYEHTAIVANVTTSKPHAQTAWQCFHASGPIALLPLEDAYQTSLVWSCDTAQADALMALDDAAFCQALSQRFFYRLGDVTASSKRYSFPLVARHAAHYTKPRIVLAGDAAHTIHPLAGQGLNLGIADALCLAKTIEAAISAGKPFTSQRYLRQYARERKAKNAVMLKAMRAFKQTFASQSATVSLARSLGLGIANRCRLLKKFFIEEAMH